jgi:ABC-2 type transport system permease protein
VKRLNLINIKAIARKEYYHLIRDFRSLYLAFIIPLLLIFMFGYALSLDVKDIRVAVADQDRTDMSRNLISSLDASAYFDVVARPSNSADAIELLDREKAILALIIPPGWTSDGPSISDPDNT